MLIAQIVNYAVKSLIILMGLALIFGVWEFPNADPTMIRVFGVIFVLWGIYRIVLYKSKLKKYADEENSDEEAK